jgi:hypothetical protein
MERPLALENVPLNNVAEMPPLVSGSAAEDVLS